MKYLIEVLNKSYPIHPIYQSLISIPFNFAHISISAPSTYILYFLWVMEKLLKPGYYVLPLPDYYAKKYLPPKVVNKKLIFNLWELLFTNHK